ncbi:hypothetical protein NKJ06_00465 [Mesorhizobium sp. M0293]
MYAQSIQPALVGVIVELVPLQQDHSSGLLSAAADGALWNLKTTVIPGPDTIDGYVANALAGRQAGTVMPYAIMQSSSAARD